MRRIHYRFGVVLGLILVSLAFQLAAPEGDGARLVAVILQGATLIAAVVASRAHRWVTRLTVGAVLLVVAGAAAAVLGSDQFGRDSAHVVALLLVGLAPPAIVSGLVKHFREEGGVTLQMMFGVLCLYLLVGLLFAAGFDTIDELSGEAFFRSGAQTTSNFLYFSFATLTTTGYGDLVAATNLGRSLAITEALLGQVYLVTVVAVIVANLRAPRRRGA